MNNKSIYLILLILATLAVYAVADLRLNVGLGKAEIVIFPDVWIEKTEGNVKTILANGDSFEVRLSSQSGDKELLFAGVSWVTDSSQVRHPGKKTGDPFYS